MADPINKAKRDAEAKAADDRLTKLIESLGGTASAQAVFGTPVEKNGVTVVPVARVRYGVGGGGGRGPARGKRTGDDDTEADQTGYGHGGGVQASPVGFIELRDGQATYTRIADSTRPMAVALLIPLVAALSFVVVVAALGRRSTRG